MTASAIEDLYPLSPLQSGMLFHSVYNGHDKSQPYIGQSVDIYEGPFDVERFRNCVERLIARHSALRSCVIWEQVDKPVQAVVSDCDLPFEVIDWTDGEGPVNSSGALDAVLAAERERALPVDKPPLIRFKIVRLSGESTVVIRTFHHLIADGWSWALLHEELRELYTAANGCRSTAIVLAPSYRAYIEWLSRQPRTEALEHWRQTLVGLNNRALTSSDAPSRSGGVGSVHAALAADESAQIRELASKVSVTVNTVLQAAWAIVLSGYTDSNDVMFGATIGGRPADLENSDKMVGLFINTLPVGLRLNPSQQIQALLKEVKDNHADLDYYAYTSLQDIKNIMGHRSTRPLFDSILVFENYAKPGVDDGVFGDLVCRHQGGYTDTDQPITLAISEIDGAYEVHATFDVSLFGREFVSGLVAAFRNVLLGLVADPEGRVGDVEVLDAGERQRLALQWSGAGKPVVDDGGSVESMVEQRAAVAPDSVAVTCGDQRVSYGQLNVRANRVARLLRERGVGPGSLVGVCLERGPELVASMLGVLKAGGVYVPMDPSYPRERLAFMIADSGMSMVVVDSRAAATAGLDQVSESLTMLVLDDVEQDIAEQDSSDLLSVAGPDDGAYVIYTSGSTGTPKGVLIPRRALWERLRSVDPFERFDCTDVWAMCHSAAFDFSVWELWGALSTGGRVVMVDTTIVRDPVALTSLLARERVTVLSQTPTAFNALQEELFDRWAEVADHLRLVVFGGEALRYPSLSRWFGAPSARRPRFINMYGITETTIHVTYHEVSARDVGAGERSTIGRPLAGTEVFVLDGVGRLCPVGVAGELWVGGVGLACGYLNRPDLTAERFVERQIEGTARRLYRTGDLVRWNADEQLEFVGRADDQVKVRGFRIELGEVEAAVLAHPGVVACAAVARDDGGEQAGARLVVYVVGAEGDSVPTVSDLRQWCARTLPDYMVPSLFVEVSAIPLTANGKADRRALPAPEDGSDEVRDSYVAPQTPVQRTIAAIWQDVLGVNTVGLHDNFFELGGNSFLSIQVSSSMIDQGLTVGTRPIFENPTIFTLAAYLGDAVAQEAAAPLPAHRPGDGQLDSGDRQGDVAMTATRNSASTQSATPAEFVEMNDSRGPRTAFLVHEISGSVFSYLDLAREIAHTHRAIAIEAPAYGSPASPPQHDICAIARQYSRQIVEHSPGPYTLAGYSFGGLIALEIAWTLEQEGHRVSSVALIDSYIADAGVRDIVKEDLRALEAAIEARSVDRPEVEVRRAVETVIHRFQLTEGVLELRASEIDKYLRILRAHTQASLDYHPRAPQCPVRLLQATESADRFRERRAWSSYPGPLEVTNHYGDHRSVMHMPGVASVARDLAEFWTAEAQ